MCPSATRVAHLYRQACNVCVASAVIDASRENFDKGYEIPEAGSHGSWPSEVKLYVRCRGTEGPEFKPGEWQVRREGEPWPEKWLPTTDLAGDMGDLGLDVKWRVVPDAVKLWMLGKTDRLPIRYGDLNRRSMG